MEKTFKRSPGKLKERRADKNCTRSLGKKDSMNLAGEEQVKHEANRRWPSKESEEMYATLNMDKKQRGRPADRVKKPDFFFPLLESLPIKQIKHVLLCASLELKSVRRYPGWILSQTYNHKNRTIDFS